MEREKLDPTCWVLTNQNKEELELGKSLKSQQI